MSDDQFYTGAAGPATGTTDFNAHDFMIQQALAQVRTSVMVKVIKDPYDNNGNPIPAGTVGPIGYIDVQPMVNQLNGKDQATEHGTVYRIPYHRPQSGSGVIISNPKAGDIGMMMCGDRDHSQVKSTLKVSNPGSRRKHDMADGMYFGTILGPAPGQWVTFKEHGLEVHDINGSTVVMDATGVKMTDGVNGNTIQMTSAGVTINGAVITPGGDIITKHGTSLDNHGNTGVTAGGDISGPPP